MKKVSISSFTIYSSPFTIIKMKFFDLIKIANRNLFRNKLRTFLTIMAIFVGSFTLVLTNGIGDGMRDYIENQVKNFEGSNILQVRKKIERPKSEANPSEPIEYKEIAPDENREKFDMDSYTLSLAQMESVAKEIPEIESVTPRYPSRGEYIQFNGGKKYRLFLGMLSEGVTQKTEAGRSINGTNQIVIPLALAKTFNENIEALIGKEVVIAYKTAAGEMKTMPLNIVGVATNGFMLNISSFVDAATARKIYEEQYAGKDDFNQFESITLRLNSGDAATFAAVKQKLDEKGMTAESFADKDKRTYDGIAFVQIGLNFFAFIALFAASFGIINTLIVAVMERTKEIGLQKALGMGRWTIFALFSLESVLIGFWGAMTGVVGGMLIGTFASLVLRNGLESFAGYSLFVFKLFSISWVVLLVCLIAFLAGVLPAWRASRLNPIEALRYE
jgi:putative ABC transport system permease protein